MDETKQIKSILSSRTLWVNLLTPIFIWVTAKYGINLDAETQTTLITGVMIAVNVLMRWLTSEPVAFTLPSSTRRHR